MKLPQLLFMQLGGCDTKGRGIWIQTASIRNGHVTVAAGCCHGAYRLASASIATWIWLS